MTNAAPETDFSPESGFAAESIFDTSRIDANMEAIGRVEQAWRLPALPDLTKLDLAAHPSATPEALTGTLLGVDDDMHRPTDDLNREPAPNRPRQELSGVDQARIVLASVSSNRPPTRVSEDAVERFKLRAIDAGLLDMESSRVDATWTPEFNRIRGELAFDDLNRAYSGDRPGAVPVNRAVQVLGDLTQPASLLSFATDLDLFWDFDAIGDEFSSWGDKWRKLGDSDGPLDFGKNLVNALTGPIDDIVFPVVNVALMFTGVGAMANVGRVGWMGRNLARAAPGFGRMFGASSRVGRQVTSGLRGIGEGFASGARLNVAEIGRASMLAEGLRRGTRAPTAFGAIGGAGIGALSNLDDPLQGALLGGAIGGVGATALRGTRYATRTGDLLARWRALAPVVTAKRGVQQGMRLGLASYAESAFPGYQGGGPSLSDIGAVDQAAERLYRIGLDPRFMPLELMFAPYNVFAPGTFFRRAGEGAGLVGRAGRESIRVLGRPTGKAAAGALAGAVGGAVAGDDAGDIAEGAAIGAGAAVAVPHLGRMLEVRRIHQGLTGALVGAGAGHVLGDDPTDVAYGALAGVGLTQISPTVAKRFMQQAGVSGLDRLIRGIGHGMVRTDYGKLEADPDIAMGFHAKMRRLLQDDPEQLQQWEYDFNSYGAIGALAKRSYGKVDDDTRQLAAAAIAVDYTTFAGKWLAHNQARSVFKEGSRRYWHAYHMARNKLTNQLRPIDLDRPAESIIQDIAKVVAWTDTRGVQAVSDLGAGAPKFVDQSGDALFRVRRRQRELVETLRADPDRAVALAEQHNNQIGDTITQLFEQRNFPKVEDFSAIPRGETNLFGDEWADMPMSARAALFGADGDYSNFGDFREWTAVTNEVRNARRDGLFDVAFVKPVTTRTGRQRAPRTFKSYLDPASRDSAQAFTDALLRGVDTSRLSKVQQTLLASAFEAGRVTPARFDFVAKQAIEEQADQIADVLSIQRLLPRIADKLRTVDPAVTSLATQGMDRAGMRIALQALVDAGIGRGAAKDVLGFARRHELTVGDVNDAVNRIGDEILESTDWTRYGFGDIAADAEGRILTGPQALTARLRELRDKAPFTAAELDLEESARWYAANGQAARAQQLRDLASDAEARGYKYVHGVEFLMPEDVAFKMPTFADATRRHMNAVTLGNWFGRRHPIEGMVADDRRRRLLVANELADAGRDVAPDGKEVTNLLDVLGDWLKREQDLADESLSLAHTEGGVVEKTLARLRSSMVPIRLDDVGGSARRQEGVLEAVQAIGYSEAEAMAVWKAVTRFRNSDFSEVGLYGLEAGLRNRSQAAGALKLLGGTRYGNHVLGRMGGQAATGAAIGAVAAGGDASLEDRIRGAVTGAAIGATSAAAVRPKAISAAETWRYGYLADFYARWRDSLRFTMSPIFDASRYTEGVVLAQTALPSRRPDGTRLALPVLSGGLTPMAASSPAGLRRKLARDAAKAAKREGGALSKRAAKKAAEGEYETWLGEFNAVAKGAKDFDRDAMDSVGRFYRQVGVLGFSPTDWMATSYAYLRGEGFDQKAAYEAAKGAYTYATHGRSLRSAAELSANFVFFPFSFQKKALGHIGRWLNDDLGRSIILHDALKTYEVLDERYDLERRWKDHIPFLQQLQRLNLFAYGLSPGRFGGINSQLFQTAGTTLPFLDKFAWNAFIPVGVQGADNAQAEEMERLGRSLLPVWNDINQMAEEVREVAIPNIAGALPGSPMEAMSFNAQVRDGWSEYNRIRDDFETALAEKGYTLADMHNKAWLAEPKARYEQQVAQLAQRYPAWFTSRAEIPGNRIAVDMERKNRINAALAAVAQGIEPSPDNRMVAEMQQFIDQQLNDLELVSGTRDPQFAPPQLFSIIHNKAIEFARRNPSFRHLWKRFWQREYGLIEENLMLA